MRRLLFSTLLCLLAPVISALAAPVIDPIPSQNIPAGKSLILPVTATSTNGRPLTFTATSSTNRITVQVHTNNPFWKMSVVQAAPANAPGAFQTPYRGGVVTVTNVGDMTFMLFRDIAPHTVDVMQGLTDSGFYNSNTIFHRVIPGFVIQGGDPNTNGSGGTVFLYNDEFNPQALFSGNGQLALANSGPNTDESQFFISVGPQRALDFGYTLYGQLLRGFPVLTNISLTPTSESTNNRPNADVIITRASLVPDTSDTVLTLAGTNLAGVAGTISVVADDGAGGKATNTFAATTVTDTVSEPFIFYPATTVTNLVTAVNGHLTNYVSVTDLADPFYFFYLTYDTNSTMSGFVADGNQVQMTVVPNANYTGTSSYQIVASTSPEWLEYYEDYQSYSFLWPPYIWEECTFDFGDTPISSWPSNFIAKALVPFTNQVLAAFTNGVANSPHGNFTAFINWGDNSTNAGAVVANGPLKEVQGSHTYTNAGTYPIYIDIQSAEAATNLVVCTASVPPTLSLARAGANPVVSWPAWAVDYQLQRETNIATPSWATPTNFPVLVGYTNFLTNSISSGNSFFRLKQ
jgi:cyclophilin family peptidyl-prolyl cis-trans isomerase